MNQIRYVPNPEARSRGHLKQSADHVAVGILGEEKNSSGGRGQPRASHPRRWSSTRHQSSSSGSWGGNTWWSTRWRSSRAGHPQRWTPQRGVKKLATHQAHVCSTCFTHVFCAHVRIFVMAHGGVSFFLTGVIPWPMFSFTSYGHMFTKVSALMSSTRGCVLILSYSRVIYAILSVAESSS